ncbi:hypothetical protein FisN_16Lh116 [Fistulifera solaris]|uniref:Uncharacterized protein n=1 Tax=Fistulifera solaris TaxID=1519565 RepID=A0A1Z5KJH7_FISSO|nr:hypothetical protein FisN_16Lh116 [Fistulifera solaris]|eukprot:GAX26285.1 hypothetical protein FisN_16Lh116 [Fistulifera solaris]
MQENDYSRRGNVLLQKMTILEQSEKEKRRTSRILERERYAPEAIHRVFLQQPVVLRQSALADQLSDDDGDGVIPKSRSLFQQIQYEFQETVSDLQTATKGVMNGLAELNPMDERSRLRQSVRICAEALVAVKLNAAVKIQHLQLQIVSLQQELAEASGILSKLTVENDALRRQIDELQKESLSPEGGSHQFCRVDLTAETHLNSLLLSRNQVIQENTNLKKMLLHTCPSCRERLPLRKAQRSMSTSGSSVHSAEPQSPERPIKTDDSSTQLSSSTSQQQVSRPQQQSAEKSISRPTWQATARSVLHRLQSEAPSDSHTEKVGSQRNSTEPTKIAPLSASKPDTIQNTNAPLQRTVDRSKSDHLPAALVRTSSALASQIKSHIRAVDSLPDRPTGSAERTPRSRPPSRSGSGDSGRFIPPPPPSLVESSLNELTSFLFPATTPKRPKS